ncbi:16010_t:CDS:2 [Cetraspora pellucida]|uniref:16010_t:CDS:1 n=1 Tax=Cetraspora pellucida TaxID=1433469 RepID=A0ACA9N886_9GLOM|nr:16010_t:CDS:2 [Cetraspora pellucida]
MMKVILKKQQKCHKVTKKALKNDESDIIKHQESDEKHCKVTKEATKETTKEAMKE